MPLDIDILGQGIYTPRQAARLVGTSPQQILRWTRGSGPKGPLWQAHYQTIDDATELNFIDLIEVRVVSALRRAKISMQSIRFAITYAQEKLGIDHPLVSENFKTAGKEVLIEAIEKDGELVSLSKDRAGQKVFTQLVSQSLSDLEYDDGQARRWRPYGSKHVVVDPMRLFGEPILDEFGISTKTIASEHEHFQDIKYLANIYEIPRELIRSAIQFERQLDRGRLTDGQSSS